MIPFFFLSEAHKISAPSFTAGLQTSETIHLTCLWLLFFRLITPELQMYAIDPRPSPIDVLQYVKCPLEFGVQV